MSDELEDTLLRRIAAAPAVPVATAGEFAGNERFELRHRLGRGGFGTVYETLDRDTGDVVALKTMRDCSPEWLYRFKREFRTVAGVAHPNLVRLYELACHEDQWFFTMERIDGQPLTDWLDGSEARLRGGFGQLAHALVALHEVGALHRDVKPANVLVDAGGRVVLVDFGLASRLDASQSTVLAGTPVYMSPEQCRQAPLEPPSDWYAFGVMLYEVLAGRPPFEGPALALMQRKQQEDAPPLEVGPDDLRRLCMALLARDPASRPSPSEVLRVLSTTPDEHVPEPSARGGEGECFVGRQAELDALLELLARTDEPRLAFVHGPSGMGKSTLLARFASVAASRDPDALVLSGRCYQHESVPYKALDEVVDQLAGWLARRPAEEVAALLPRALPELTRLFPVLLRVSTIARHANVVTRRSGEPTGERHRGMAGLRELLARVADRRRVLLLLDDLQWGDEDSAALLGELLQQPEAPTVCVVGSYRTDERSASPLLGRLDELYQTRLNGVSAREIELAPLGVADARAVAETVLGADAGARIARVVGEAGGLPFLLHELSRLDTDVAATSLLHGRLEELGGSARRLLEVVAVAGRPLSREVALQASGVDRGAAALLAELEAARLLRSRGTGADQQLTTYHDRIREAVTEGLGEFELRTTHRRLGEAFEGQSPLDPERIALHLRLGGRPGAAVGYAIEAADRALEALAFSHAAHLYGLALDLPVPPDHDELVPRARLIRKRAEALWSAGEIDRAGTTFLEAAAAVDGAEALDLRRRGAEALLLAGDCESGVEVMGDVLSELGLPVPRGLRGAIASAAWAGVCTALDPRPPAPPSPEQARRIETLWSATMGLANADPALSLATAAHCRRHARRSSEPRHQVMARFVEALAPVTQRGPKGAAKTARRVEVVRAAAESAGDPFALTHLQVLEALAAAFELRVLDARDRSVETVASTDELGLSSTYPSTLSRILYAATLYELGDVRRSVAEAPALLEDMSECGHATGWGQVAIMLGHARALMGTPPSELRDIVEEVIVKLERSKSFAMYSWWLDAMRSSMAQLEGRSVEGWQIIAPALERARRAHLLPGFTGVNGLTLCGRLAIAAAVESEDHGLLRHAERHARALRKRAMPWPVGLSEALHAGVAATRGDARGAERHLAAAEPALAEAGLELMAQLVARARGALIGGEEGRALREAAEARVDALGADLAVATRLLLPGIAV